jgi:hypothetical protein
MDEQSILKPEPTPFDGYWLGLLTRSGEVQAPSYRRIPLAGMLAHNGDHYINVTPLEFPVVGENETWGPVTGIGLYPSPDASTPERVIPTAREDLYVNGEQLVLNAAELSIKGPS